MRPNTSNQQHNFFALSNEEEYNRSKQRSSRAHTGQNAQKSMANQASAEQVYVLGKSPKKRFFSKNGTMSIAIACSYQTTKSAIIQNDFANFSSGLNILPEQGRQSREALTNDYIEKPAYQSFDTHA